MSQQKNCQHLHIAYLGEMSPTYTGPLFTCFECGHEWRLRDVRETIRQAAEFASVLRDIANEDNIWCDPVIMARETLNALAAALPPAAGAGGGVDALP